jgi:tRNA nucleotidyltransferase (CCA-adding enzyme)
MNELKKTVKENKFEKVGEWDMQAKYQACEVVESKYNTHPSVYVWVVENKLKFVPVYVGKAGKGVIKRMKEHEHGFKGPLTKGGTKS